jgi:hypothetical protein
MLRGFAAADHGRGRPPQPARHLGADNDQRAAAVADDAAVEPMQRVARSSREAEHLLDRDGLAEHRVRVVLGVLRRCHLIHASCSDVVPNSCHVAHRAHAVGFTTVGP